MKPIDINLIKNPECLVKRLYILYTLPQPIWSSPPLKEKEGKVGILEARIYSNPWGGAFTGEIWYLSDCKLNINYFNKELSSKIQGLNKTIEEVEKHIKDWCKFMEFDLFVEELETQE